MLLPHSVVQDVRYGTRMLVRHAGFTVLAIFALALGIGVNTAAFTAYKAFFTLPLDASNPGTMVNLALVVPSGAIAPFFSYADYENYRDGLHSFSGLIAIKGVEALTVSGAGGAIRQRNDGKGTLMTRLGMLPASASDAQFAATAIVSDNYFSVLGVPAFRGRIFTAEDAPAMMATPAVVISENYWQKRFGGDATLVGKTIHLNGVAVTVMGIAPHDFVGTLGFDVPDFWLPLSLESLVHGNRDLLQDRENQCCRLFARLAPHVGISQAQAEMTLLAERLRGLHDPHSKLRETSRVLVWPGSPWPLPMSQYGGMRFAIFLIMLAVGMVLTIACANVANLQLARSASRQNELAMRLSLGASRRRLIRQLLTESALLSLIAGVVALFCSWGLLRALVALLTATIPAEYGTLVYNMTPDLGVFAFVFAISIVAGVLFGLAPAFESSRSALATALKEKAGTSSRRLREFLIAGQVCVALTLMIAGSMLIHSSLHVLKVDPGYNVDHVVELNLRFPEGAKYPTERKLSLYRELRGRLASLPGVAAITSANPPFNGYRKASVSLNGELSPRDARRIIDFNDVQADYFETLGISLLLGNHFPSQAGDGSVVVSESAAKQLWSSQNPLGRTLRMTPDEESPNDSDKVRERSLYRVVGVARDVSGAAFDGSDRAVIYRALPEEQLLDYPILIRTQGYPKRLIDALASVTSLVDPDLAANASTLQQLFRSAPTFFIPSSAAAVATPLGFIGLLLASMGVYGTVSYIVVLRTREVGIRMALGARRRDILILMLLQGMRPVFAGLLVGLFLAAGASYLLRGVLHGLGTVDSISFLFVSLLFLLIALLASYVPSRRATLVDPNTALRFE